MNKTIKSCYGACDDCNESEMCSDAPKRIKIKKETIINLLDYTHEIPPWKLKSDKIM